MKWCIDPQNLNYISMGRLVDIFIGLLLIVVIGTTILCLLPLMAIVGIGVILFSVVDSIISFIFNKIV